MQEILKDLFGNLCKGLVGRGKDRELVLSAQGVDKPRLGEDLGEGAEAAVCDQRLDQAGGGG